MTTDYSDLYPWRCNLNWFGMPWKPRGLVMKAIDKLYFWSALAVPLGGWRWRGWRMLYVMRARFYFEFRDELERPKLYESRETLSYDFMNDVRVKP